jgi:hypothetical protein
MPFSSLNDANDLARACRVLDSAWAKIQELNLVRGDPENERTGLAHIVAGLLLSAETEEDLVDLAVARYLERNMGRDSALTE